MANAIEEQTKVYADPYDFRKEADKLAKDGWHVQNTERHQPRSGFFRTVSGARALGSQPKEKIVVTYVRWADKKKRRESPPPGM